MANKFNVWSGTGTNYYKSDNATYTTKAASGFTTGDKLNSQQFNTFLKETSLATVSLLDAVLEITGSSTDIEIDPTGGISRETLKNLIKSGLTKPGNVNGTGTKVTVTNGVVTSVTTLQANDLPQTVQDATNHSGQIKIGNDWYTASLSGSTLTLTKVV